MTTNQAIAMLERRIDWLERRCLPARLVGKPWKVGEAEIEANEKAVKALRNQKEQREPEDL